MKRRLVRLATPSLLLLALLLAACGANARTLALRTGLVSLNVARDTLLTVSKTREAQIIAATTTKESGAAQLATWRGVVDKVAAAIEDGYRAIYGAALLDDAASAASAASAVADALTLLKDLQGFVNPLKTTPQPQPPPTTTSASTVSKEKQ